MKEQTLQSKTGQQSEKGSVQSVAGSRGVSVAPPAYGMDFLDRPEPNRSGLPDQLKAGVENLSGLAMDDVMVHHNSQKPAQLQALAYTRGSEIHLGPGQEKHLPHEAWHVVQQKQGRVRPSIQMKTGIPINDDAGLEREADTMGKRLVSMKDGLFLAGADPDETQSNPAIERVRSYPSAVQSQGCIVQRFESDEHQHLGDTATGSATYNLGSQTDKFELTHGDILALSGDVFKPDELFDLAAIPGDHGQKVGTRDEVLCALQDERIWEMRGMPSGPYAGKKDPRFQPGGPYANYVFSDKVKEAVFERYRKLGAANAGHFVAPQGRDPSGAILPASESAGAGYRKFHEKAIQDADKAGRAGADIGMAMAREAAAQHFLTDEFSAGHLRTPAAAIREYWGNKYPLFWYNLRHKIAFDTALDMWVPTRKAYPKILASVEALVPKLPAVTLGDLLASVFHDVDNEQGLSLAGGGRVFGDKHLDAATTKLATAAIQAGNKDIVKAYDIGKQIPRPVADADLFAQVRFLSGGVGDKYAAETMIPEPSKAEPPQNWKASDINTLWDQKMIGNTGDTVGEVISKRIQGGPIAIQLTSLADNFPPSGDYNTHPRQSYLDGFVRKLQANPKAGVLDIINWAPHDMGTGNLAEAARESASDLERKGAGGDKKENLSNMTLEQKIKYVTLLMNNHSDADQDTIITIFQNTSVPDRLNIYEKLEGHPWKGDFQRTIGKRDELYKAMSGKRVDKLKDLINGI